MKNLKVFALVVGLLPVLSTATSFDRTSLKSHLAPNIVELKITNVEEAGSVLKSTHQHPYTKFLIAIPVEVSTGDVCTEFVGQVTGGTLEVPTLKVLGSKDPLVEACIQILPQPVYTQLTFTMSVITGGYVPAQPIQTTDLRIGQHPYRVTLDMSANSVTIEPLK